jgi:choice-of-anchor A domain-containing protein
MKKQLLLTITTILLLFLSNTNFSQTLDLGTLSTFEAYTGAGAVTNNGDIIGDAGTNDGIVSGLGFGLGYIGTTYQNNPTTVQARIDLLRVYIHLSDVFVDYVGPGAHAPAFGGAETLTSGVYSTAGAGSLTGPITLDGQGDPDAYFILKFDGAFTVGVGSEIILTNGTRAANVFWISEGAMSIGASSFLKGTFISHPGAVSVGLNCTLEGRLFSTEGAITVGAGTVAVMPTGNSTIPINCSGNCSPAAAVDVLGSLKQYALFTSAGAVANAATSGIVGDIGTNLGVISGFTTSTQVGSINLPSAATAQAVADLANAYIQIKLLPNTHTGHLAAFGGGETVLKGVYYTAGAGSLAGTITLDAQGDSDAIFVFKFNGAFSAAAQSKVILKNGARRCNVFWTSEGATDIGTFSHMKGTIIANAGAATMAANGNLEGRLLSTAGAIGFSTGVVYNDSLCFGDDTPISDGDQTVCLDGTANQTLTASATSNTTAGSIVWFNAPTGGNAVSPATQVGLGSATYYAASYNGTYYSPNRVAVTLTINDCSIDTDGDGIPDSTDTDDDGDGINDADEALIGTNPLLFDTDGDGNSDGVDDFDGDGISNDDESDENIAIATDIDGLPGNDIVTALDTDGDGIPDSTDTDDDGDGINDADEALIGTNPLLFDTDGDGNSDGVDDYDGDGISNDDESDENIAIVTDIAPADGNPDITFALNTPPSVVLYNPTAPAECFNVFVENNITLVDGNTNGSIAAGGDLNLNGNYTVASQDCGCFDVNGNKIGLLVGGRVIYSSNNILSVTNGSQYAKIGESNGSNAWYQDPLNAPAPIRVTPGSDYNTTSHIQLQGNAVAFNATTNNNHIFSQNVLDFSLAFQRLRTNSTSLSQETNNAQLTDINGTSISNTNLPSTVKINLQNGINYLDVTSADLNNVDTFIYNQQPDATRIVVINVNAAGTFNWDVWQQTNVGLIESKYILFNFYNTTSLQIEGNEAIYGTVLAPFADINKTVNSETILGQVIGLSLNHNGGEVQCAAFTLNIESPLPAGTGPTAEFTIDNDELCFYDNEFNFTNTSNTGIAYQPVNSISYTWDFGDGTNSILMNPTKIYLVAGTYTVTLVATNTFGSETQIAQITVLDPPNHPVITKATLNSNPGTVTREITLVNAAYYDSWSWSIVGGASGLYPNQNVVSFDFIATGTYEIIVTGNKDGCSELKTITFVIPSSEVSGGNGGGIESESLGDAISKIYVNRKKNSVPTNFVKSDENLFNKAKLKRAQPYLGKGPDLSMLDMFPTELVAGNVANVTSPTDILDYTVAEEVLSVDFSVDGKTKGVVLGIRTSDKIYNHTKASCDRLRGAEILNIQTVALEGYNFLMQGIKQRNGVVEYAISFAVAKNRNEAKYTIQTNWYVNHYTKFNDVYNFQVWSSNPTDTQKLVKDILANLISSIPVNQTEIQTVPTTFAAKVSREAADLIIKMKSISVGQNIEISLDEIYSETTSTVRYRYNPLNTELEQTLRIDISDGYEYDGLITINGEIQDAFYHADGNWGLDYDNQYTTVNEYVVSNNFDRIYKDDEYAVHRDVKIKAVSEYDYLGIYKSLLPGNLSADYSAYKYLSFTAKGSGLIELGLLKSSVEMWTEQYRVMLDLSAEEQTYYVPFDSFTSTGTTDKITVDDLTTILFTFLPVEAKTNDLDLTISDVKFTKTSADGALGLITTFKNNFMIYPNPSKGNVKVLLFSEVFTDATVSLYDVTGKEIYTMPIQLTNGKNEIDFNVKVKPGILFLKVNSQQVNYGTSKIIFR